MKIKFYLLLLVLIGALAMTQGTEKIVEISDQRSTVNYKPDTNAIDKNEGDVFIDHLLTHDENVTRNLYMISFFKRHEGRLRHFDIGIVEDATFDRASYNWKNDTVVTMMLFNTQSTQFKVVSFVKEGNLMDIAPTIVK